MVWNDAIFEIQGDDEIHFLHHVAMMGAVPVQHWVVYGFHHSFFESEVEEAEVCQAAKQMTNLAALPASGYFGMKFPESFVQLPMVTIENADAHA